MNSWVETVEANNQQPHAWLPHTLECLPQALAIEDVESLRPWNC
nr:transposase domain-containing protein [Pseudomonas sp. 31-12]